MKKVFVGMSGGVDSSVTAYLLKKQGFLVEGVFINIKHPSISTCTSSEDKINSMRACANLEMKFHLLDASKEYNQKVIEPFIEAYKKGETPNPDILCNKSIKFDSFYKYAKGKGADFIATGHYAKLEDGYIALSKDKEKDQTYFLWAIDRAVIADLIFPLGDYTKKEVREIARKAKLPSANLPDSTGICFIGEFNIKDFLKNYIDESDGDIYLDKEKVGKHNGAHLYTVGQKINKNFVVAKDIKKNIIFVNENVDSVSKKEYELKDMNLFFDVEDVPLKARIRHGGELLDARLKGNIVCFDKKVLVAEGQSIVLYKQNKCAGGGIVSSGYTKINE